MSWGFPALGYQDPGILTTVFGFAIAWLALAAVVGWLAGRTGRDSGLWFVLGFFLGPIALVAIIALGSRRGRPRSTESGDHSSR